MAREEGSVGRSNDSSDASVAAPPLPPRRQPSVDGGGLQAKATTAISPIDIQTLSFPDGSRGTFSTAGTEAATTPARVSSGEATPNLGGFNRIGSSEADDSMSIVSFAQTLRPPGDLASLVAGELNKKSRAWNMLRAQSATVRPFERRAAERPGILDNFEREFDDIPDGSVQDTSDEERLSLWKSKLKHYLILSSAGKPIWSRHGDTSLINSYMGVIQTIISFYDGAENPLRGFTAGNTRFVVSTEGPLYLVAVSRLGESDAQLRGQLAALYMQILSTLTLPTLTNIFANRPSTDLRKPLQGTESLLSSLADSFTKGSPTALLGALECLRLRKSQRHSINNTFLKQRADKLLYGLLVAGGKLVSVIRPRRHSLHPSDLQLIFNMLFESGGVKAGGGENWIPLCLPAFNSRGYLYMYVSFFDGAESELGSTPEATATTTATGGPSIKRDTDEEIAIILISPDKESFFDLKEMRGKVATQLAKNGSLDIIKTAARAGRPQVADVCSGSSGSSAASTGGALQQQQQQISHFLYKSRVNVQFCMSALSPAFGPAGQPDLVARRRLMTAYHGLHAAVRGRHAHLKVLHCVARDAASLAWVTPAFELYCVAGPNASRAAMTQGANRIIQWAKKEEERLFIVGGGVF